MQPASTGGRARNGYDQWNRIEHLLPGRPGSVEVAAADNRLFGEAVLFRYRAGIPWRDLPAPAWCRDPAVVKSVDLT
jgi:transposase